MSVYKRKHAPSDHEWDDGGNCKWCPANRELMTKPSDAAMRAAKEIRESWQLDCGFDTHMATIIDRETNLPELLAAAEEAAEFPDKFPKCRFNWDRLRAAIAKCKGTP